MLAKAFRRKGANARKRKRARISSTSIVNLCRVAREYKPQKLSYSFLSTISLIKFVIDGFRVQIYLYIFIEQIRYFLSIKFLKSRCIFNKFIYTYKPQLENLSVWKLSIMIVEYYHRNIKIITWYTTYIRYYTSMRTYLISHCFSFIR